MIVGQKRATIELRLYPALPFWYGHSERRPADHIRTRYPLVCSLHKCFNGLPQCTEIGLSREAILRRFQYN